MHCPNDIPQARQVKARHEASGSIVARLDHLVKVADGPVPYRSRQWTVVPDGLIAFEQKATNQIGSG